MNKDGSIRWVEINGVKIMWDKSPATLNFIKDVTARRLAEEALKVSEEKYRTLVDNMHDAVYRCDLDGNLVFTTPSAARILGCSSVEEMIGSKVAGFLLFSRGGRKTI